MSNILVTGGLGYIGSHTIVKLLENNHKVFCVDNLSNSSLSVKEKICKITRKDFELGNFNVCDETKLNKFVNGKHIDSIIHFAAYKAVGESVKDPLKYYENNLLGLISVLKVCKQNNVTNIVFSSSATVYGSQTNFPITEDSPLNKPNSAYGTTKLVGEYILEDCAKAYNFKIVALRYFNPIGAHESGMIGESPNGIPNNLLPYITKVAKGELKELTVYGEDYDTIDGTCIRDYIDVCDLADAHVRVIEKIKEIKNQFEVYNIGTNKGTTVKQIIDTFERVNNLKVNYKIGPRREGDVEKMYCDYSKIKEDFGWEPSTSLEDSLKNSWRWENNK